MRGWRFMIAAAASLALAGGIAAQRKPAPRPAAKPVARLAPQVVTPPKARYAMDVGTTTGLGGMMAGGGKPDMGMMMKMATGGGGAVAHELHLRLGSTLAPTSGTPTADHFFEPPAAMGASVPLMPPPPAREGEMAPIPFERPKGRLIIYWGCGAHAGAGQPVIIDFSTLSAGQVPPDLFTGRAPVDRGPMPGTSRTYADWPNQRSGRMPQGGSLIGAHRVAANFAPEINFTLDQDYMAGLQVRAAAGAEGTLALSWNAVPRATGYYAWMIGSNGAGRRGRNDTGDIVWWSSSNSREFGGALWDWISPATAEKLVAEGTVMAPTTTNCTVPAEAKAAAGQGMFGTLVAYGPEANFVYPPRPDKGPWNQEWTARVRFRSMTSFMPGMPDMSGNDGSGQGAGKPKKRCKPSLLGAVTGIGC